MTIEDARREVAEHCRRMSRDGLVVGTSGNISIRVGDLVVVTPSGLDYDVLTPDLVCVTDLAGEPVTGDLAPTTELPMHLAVYRGTDHTAVVHTHSTAATAVSALVTEVPSVHYLVALFGGPIRVAEYATFGTSGLADNALTALEGRRGCLLANHGTLTVADGLPKAYDLARYLEWLCEVWLRARAVGDPAILPAEEIGRVVEKIATYGQSASLNEERL